MCFPETLRSFEKAEVLRREVNHGLLSEMVKEQGGKGDSTIMGNGEAPWYPQPGILINIFISYGCSKKLP